MAYKRKIFAYDVFHGYMKWTNNRNFVYCDEAIAFFEFCVRKWPGFSHRIVNKETGAYLRQHIGTCTKYARDK